MNFMEFRKLAESIANEDTLAKRFEMFNRIRARIDLSEVDIFRLAFKAGEIYESNQD